MLFEFNCGTNKNPSWEVLPVEGERIECVTTTLKHSHSSTADLIVLCGRKKEKQPHLIRLTSYPDGRQNLIGTAASQINLIPLSDLYRGCFTGISKKNCTVHIIIVNWRGGGQISGIIASLPSTPTNLAYPFYLILSIRTRSLPISNCPPPTFNFQSFFINLKKCTQ